jgi:DNA recombination protein RmuC
MIEPVVFLVIGLTIGAVLTWLGASVQRARLAEAQGRVISAEGHVADLSIQLREQRELRSAAETTAARVPALEDQLRDARVEGEQRLARLMEVEGRSDERQQAFEASKAALETTFQALSAQALQANNDSFLKLATSSMEKFQVNAQHDLDARGKAVETLVQPIKDSLTRVDGKLGEIEKERQMSYSALNEQLRGLVDQHLPMLRNETANLVKALRQPTVRGRWGEIQLRRVVEMAGMLDHCDFFEQQSEDTGDGRLRPDVIVRLPGNKQIVIDAKAPLAAYLEAAEATDDATRDTQLARHVQQVRNHMSALGRKAYWENFEPTPEFVVMFLPGEAFFSAALQQDPSLIEFGVNEKVIPATPTTLIALLRAVSYGWRQESLALNAAEIAELGRELYDRLSKLGDHWRNVGKGLGRAVEAYNQSVGALESRVLSSARKFRDLEAVSADADIEPVTPLEQQARLLTSAELSVIPDSLPVGSAD